METGAQDIIVLQWSASNFNTWVRLYYRAKPKNQTWYFGSMADELDASSVEKGKGKFVQGFPSCSNIL